MNKLYEQTLFTNYTPIKIYVEQMQQNIESTVKTFTKCVPSLTIIQVGDNKASNSYIKGKIKDCDLVGIKTKLIKLDDSVTKEKLIKIIKKENKNKRTTGIIVQLPLPDHLKKYQKDILNMISCDKDVDGLNDSSTTTPCTPKGIMDWLTYCGYSFKGKHAVIIGRSDLVGKPMAKLLLQANCTTSIIHSKTPDKIKQDLIYMADLIVCAVGIPNYLNYSIKYPKSCIIIDVGINRDDNNILCGDCSRNLPVYYQSPVPGGVGLLTRLALLTNLIYLYKKQNYR